MNGDIIFAQFEKDLSDEGRDRTVGRISQGSSTLDGICHFAKKG